MARILEHDDTVINVQKDDTHSFVDVFLPAGSDVCVDNANSLLLVTGKASTTNGVLLYIESAVELTGIGPVTTTDESGLSCVCGFIIEAGDINYKLFFHADRGEFKASERIENAEVTILKFNSNGLEGIWTK